MTIGIGGSRHGADRCRGSRIGNRSQGSESEDEGDCVRFVVDRKGATVIHEVFENRIRGADVIRTSLSGLEGHIWGVVAAVGLDQDVLDNRPRSIEPLPTASSPPGFRLYRGLEVVFQFCGPALLLLGA